MGRKTTDSRSKIERAIHRLERDEPLNRTARDKLIDILKDYQENVSSRPAPSSRSNGNPTFVNLFKLLESIGEQAEFAVFLKDQAGQYMYVNQRWGEYYGIKGQQVVGRDAFDLFDPPRAEKLNEQDRRVIEKGERIVNQEFNRVDDDKARYFSIHKFPILDIPGMDSAIGGITIDITRMKEVERQLKKSEERLALAQKIAGMGSWELDLECEDLYWSEQIYRIFEVAPVNFDPSYEAFLSFVHPEDRNMVDEVYKNSLENATTYHITHRLLLADNKVKYVEEQGEHFYVEQGNPVRSIGTIQDVTDRKDNQRKLKKSLEEKQAMLSEIHHRVKNNLAMVSGMLELQWFDTDDPETADKLQESFNRIKTIAKIHEQLYQSKQFAKTDLSENLRKLGRDIIYNFHAEKEIDFSCDCDPVELDMEKTLPCSLIANEVLTNIVKHAFQDRKGGAVRMVLKESDGQINLQIKDDGVGLPDDFHRGDDESLGMRIIETQVTQLGAEYRIVSDDVGTTFSLEFDNDRDIS